MTIVLQHQFWDLEVTPEGFSVALSFDGKTDTLSIPFDAVVAFADPSVKFGLQFGQDGELEGVDDSGMLPDEASGAQDSAAAQALPTASGGERASSDEAEDAEDAPENDDEKVVALDRFRKKPADR
jgi:hypothetical protein